MEERAAFWTDEERGYSHMHGTKPQTLGYSLNDSPVGLAAWIVEKYRSWCDCDGNPETRFSKDELLTTLTIYWATETATSAARYYYEGRHGANSPDPARIEVPTACAAFPGEFRFTPRRWLEARYNLVRLHDDAERRPLRGQRSAGAAGRRTCGRSFGICGRVSGSRLSRSRRGPERVDDGQSLYALSMLQVLAVEGPAPGIERRRHYQTVVHGESVACPHVETASIQRPAWIDPPEREEHVVHHLAHLLGSRAEPSDEDVHRFLDDLVTDAPASIRQASLNEAVGDLALPGSGLVEQVDEDVGVQEVVNAHSSRPW